jgi:cell division protein FtsB
VTLAYLRRPVWWLAALPLAALVANTVAGRSGLVDLWRLYHDRAALDEEVYRLLRQNDDLRQRILTLRRSDRDLERLARRQLGLVRDDEIVYRFHPRPAASPHESSRSSRVSPP